MQKIYNPDDLPGYAASAAASLFLWEEGIDDHRMTSGLKEGIEFCDAVQYAMDELEKTGGTFRGADLPLVFRVASWRGMHPNVMMLFNRAAEVKGQLEAVLAGNYEGSVTELGDYFNKVTCTITYHDDIQRLYFGDRA